MNSLEGSDRRWVRDGLESVSAVQQQKSRELKYGQISRGTFVDLPLFCEQVGVTEQISKLAVNLGAGDGYKAVRQAAAGAHAQIELVGIDINAVGLEHGKMLSHFAGVRNAFFMERSAVDPGWVEELGGAGKVGLCVTEGLFCNLLGDDLAQGLEQIGRALKPGGRFLISDCLHVDDPEGNELLMNDSRWGPDYIARWQERWRERYLLNSQAFGYLESARTFVVMPPGEVKQELEMAPPPVLRRLVMEDQIERFARHLDKAEFVKMCQMNRLSLQQWEPKIWTSRAGEPILGMVAVFEKKPAVLR